MSLYPWRAYTFSMMFGLFVTLRKSCLSFRGPASEIHFKAAHANLKANTGRTMLSLSHAQRSGSKPLVRPKTQLKEHATTVYQPASKQRADLLSSNMAEYSIEDTDVRALKHWQGYYNVQGICDQSNSSCESLTPALSPQARTSESIAYLSTTRKQWTISGLQFWSGW